MSLETRQLPLQGRSAEIRSFDEGKRTFDLVWSTGAKVRRYDWRYERAYDEELSLDKGHVRMERLASGRAPLLDDHNRWAGVRSALGVVQVAALAKGEGTATVKFSKRADAAEIMADVADGITTSISVGYRVYRSEMVPPKKDGDVWIYRAVDWEPYELSLTPIPAETGANVRSDENTRTFPCEFINPAESPANTQEHPMIRSFASTLGVKVEKDATDAAVRSAVIAHLGLKADATDEDVVAATLKRSAPPAPAAAVPTAAEGEEQIRSLERKRIAGIGAVCDKFRSTPELRQKAILENWSEERTGFEILNERHAKGESAGPVHTTQGGEQVPAERAAIDHAVRSLGGK